MIQLRNASADDAEALLTIYNHAVIHTTATFDLQERTREQQQRWMQQYGGRYPLIVAEREGTVVGFACLSPHRSKPAYAQTAEISLYIAPNAQGQGIGSRLMSEILHQAEQLKYHVIVAGITEGNEASVRLHEKYGFQYVGCFREVGYKFGQWLDVCYYQRMLPAK
jgi:L-amino acid N-acyltransferase